jgi:hypothetical protein
MIEVWAGASRDRKDNGRRGNSGERRCNLRSLSVEREGEGGSVSVAGVGAGSRCPSPNPNSPMPAPLAVDRNARPDMG